MKITEKQLIILNACESGIQWFVKQKKRTLKLLIPALLKDNHFDYARWLLLRLMTNPQKAMWAISSAELVLQIFEKKYPNDMRPRNAIKAAKDFLSGKIAPNAAAYAAANAAANAANAAANSAYAAANAAAYAANSAYAAANAAANSANSAYAAANAAANAASVVEQICDNGLKILGEIK